MASWVAQLVRIHLQCRIPQYDSWVRKIPWRRKWQPTPGFLPGESHGQRSLVGYSPRGHKESDMTEQLHFDFYNYTVLRGFPGGSDGKESAYTAGDPGLIPGSGRSLGGGNGNSLQYFCLGNHMDRGAWQASRGCKVLGMT